MPVRSMRAYDGDLYLLCSDGLSGALSDDQIEAILEGSGSPTDLVRALIDAALAAGAHDSIATVVLRCRETDVPRVALSGDNGYQADAQGQP